MNLLLVDPDEVDATTRTVMLLDRRAHHMRAVLGVKPGSTVRAGVVGGSLGIATVISDDGSTMTLTLALDGARSSPLPIEVVLAVPRPKALWRVVESIASFGIERISLTNAWRVEKSYLGSPRITPEALARVARLGAEQGATTHLPTITVHDRLMQLLDARWPTSGGDDLRLIAHPGAPPIERAFRSGPLVLAVGPEGGWIEREVETFVARGFVPVSLGAAILRVEAAVPAALAQLGLLARITGG